jgi:hypothetical protein
MSVELVVYVAVCWIVVAGCLGALASAVSQEAIDEAWSDDMEAGR